MQVQNEVIAEAIRTALAAIDVPIYNAKVNQAFRADVYRREYFADEWNYFYIVRAGGEPVLPLGISSSQYDAEFFILGARRYDVAEMLPWQQDVAVKSLPTLQNEIAYDMALALCGGGQNLGGAAFNFALQDRNRDFIVDGWAILEVRAIASYMSGYGVCA
jgi:hypothetical protein